MLEEGALTPRGPAETPRIFLSSPEEGDAALARPSPGSQDPRVSHQL